MYYFVTLIFLLLSAKASFLYFSNVCWILIDVYFLWIGIKYKRLGKSDFRLFGKFALMFFLFCTFRSAFLTHLPLSFYVSDMVFLAKFYFTSFLYCALLKEHAVPYLAKVIIQLSIISMAFFCLQLVAPGLIWAIGNAINLPYRYADAYVNFIVFTFTKYHTFQNSGFSWEPGAYGFFLLIGLLLHLLSNNFTFDKGAKWLVLAILTTVSTTSYVGMLLIFLMYFRYHGVKYITLLLFAVPLLAFAVAELPFLLTKVLHTYNHDLKDMKDIGFLSKWYIQHHEQMPLNRFASMLFIYKTYGLSLIWGSSNIYNESIPIFQNINISNGIFEFFAKFGLLSLIYLFDRSYRMFYRYTYRHELCIYGLLLILILGFGESIFLISLTLCFNFFFFYVPAEHTEDFVGADTEFA